ncbi:GH25 family lysozyme [Salinifilum aidingensis]
MDRVRPAVHRAVAAVLPTLRRGWEAPAVQRFRERVALLFSRLSANLPGGEGVPTRARAMQAGGAVAAVGLVGIVIASLAGPGTQQRDVQEAAQTGEMSPGTAERMMAKAEDSPQQQAGGQQAEEQEAPAPVGPPVEGIDVSNHNGSIDWKQVAGSGKKFTFVLATDGTSFTSPTYSQQYHGAKDAGMIAGAYHFARPGSSGPEEQANRFLDVADYQQDGKSLPPVLDLEVDPNSGGCYGKSVDQMHQWVDGFNNTVKERTGEKPIIYANPSFWQQCMGGTDSYNDHPLWLAAYEVDQPSVPAGFDNWDFWQYTDEGAVPGISGNTDINLFREGQARLEQLAR